MLISEVKKQERGIYAKFEFEGSESEPFRGFIEGEVASDANGLFLAAWLPAWAAGEYRIRSEENICPVLVANLTVVAETIRRWYPDMPLEPPVIETNIKVEEPEAAQSHGKAAFISGGVDSLSMIYDLRGHIDAAVLLDYQEIAGVAAAETEERFEQRSVICQKVCDDSGIAFKSVRTNLRGLNGCMNFWMYRYHGSFLAAIANSLPFEEMYIAGTYNAKNLEPWGSHPLLDQFFSSRRVTVRHHGLHQSRLDKVKLLGDWPLALDRINVCVSKCSGGKNCGQCEKCIRTRLELMALGLDSKAFEKVRVYPEELHGLHIKSGYAWSCYEELLPFLPTGLRLIVESKKPKSRREPIVKQPPAQDFFKKKLRGFGKRILKMLGK